MSVAGCGVSLGLSLFTVEVLIVLYIARSGVSGLRWFICWLRCDLGLLFVRCG